MKQRQWNSRGLNELPEMRFGFPFNLIRKLTIKAGGGGVGGQDKDFGTVSQTDLTRSLTLNSSVAQAYIKGNNQESGSGLIFPQTSPTHCYGFVGCIIMIGHFLNHG